MRRAIILAGVISVVAVGLWPPGAACAGNLRIGVQMDSVNLGIQIGNPSLVVVPGSAVYQAPSLPYDYFVYQKRHYLFHDGNWLSATRRDGPWTVIAVGRVPRPILGVPVDYYKNRPGHWKQHGPPPWAEAKGRGKGKSRGFEHEQERGGGKGHGKDK
jgi:hypothetical protein